MGQEVPSEACAGACPWVSQCRCGHLTVQQRPVSLPACLTWADGLCLLLGLKSPDASLTPEWRASSPLWASACGTRGQVRWSHPLLQGSGTGASGLLCALASFKFPSFLLFPLKTSTRYVLYSFYTFNIEKEKQTGCGYRRHPKINHYYHVGGYGFSSPPTHTRRTHQRQVRRGSCPPGVSGAVGRAARDLHDNH